MAVRQISLAAVGLLTVADLATELKVSQRTIYTWIQDGRLPVVTVGTTGRKAYLIRAADLKVLSKPKRGRPVKETNRRQQVS